MHSFPLVDHKVCAIWLQRPKLSVCTLVWSVFSITTCTYLCDLHVFHTDPLVIGENGSYRHCLNTLPFLWGGNDGGNSTTKMSCLLHYTACKTCIVTATWRHSPIGPNTQAQPTKVARSVIWTKPHKYKHTCTENKTDKEGKFLMVLSFRWTTVLWGCLHSGPFKAFMT